MENLSYLGYAVAIVAVVGGSLEILEKTIKFIRFLAKHIEIRFK